jgi:hypothetical protein
MSGGCGGNKDDPHPCPPYKWWGGEKGGETRDTEQGVVNFLENIGYHETSDTVNYYDANEYTLVINNSDIAYGCPGGPFRSQALVTEVDEGWTYKSQAPEPNPEVFSYQWPNLLWPEYVVWWHQIC